MPSVVYLIGKSPIGSKRAGRKGAGAAMRAKGKLIAAQALKLLLTVAVLRMHAQESVILVPQLAIEGVTSVAFSPDGQLALIGSNIDHTARLMDIATGKLIRSFQGHQDWVTAVAFSPDARFVLTGSWDKTARLWDAATGEQLRAFVGHSGKVTCVAFSPDGRRVLTGSQDFTARLWDAATGNQIISFNGHSDWVNSVAFSPDGKAALMGTVGGKAILWDVQTGTSLATFVAGTQGFKSVNSVAFSPDGRLVLTGSYESTARLWDAATGRLVRSFKEADEITSVAFSPNGGYVLTGSWGNSARLWEESTGRLLHVFKGHTDPVRSVAFSPDSRFVLTGSDDKTARLWDARTGRQLRRFTGSANWVDSLAISRDGRVILTGGYDKAARLWDTTTGRQILSLAGHPSIVTAVAFSPDGKTVATGSWKMARLWSAGAGTGIRTFTGVGASLDTLEFSPDGRSLLIGTDDNALRLVDVATGEIRVSLKGGFNDFKASKFSPDGRFVATGSGGQSEPAIWDAATGARLVGFHLSQSVVEAIAYSPDGHQVLTGTGMGVVQLWDASTGELIRTFESRTRSITSLAFSPDGARAVIASDDGAVRVCDVASGKQLLAFAGNLGWVTSAVFTPNGRFILTGSRDAMTRVWDAATGQQLAALISFENGGWAVVDPEGRFDTNDLDGGAPLVWVASSEPMHPLPLEIFMRGYYTPRLLARILNGETLPPVRSIAQIENRLQPDVAIVSVSASETHPGRADVVVHAASHIEQEKDAEGNPLKDASGNPVMQASGLEDLRLFRNGQLVGYRAGKRNGGDFAFPGIRLPASAKIAAFTAYAFNSERIKSRTAQRSFAYNPGPAAKPRAWLLQIGVNRYQASGCELHGSATDAEQLSRALTERLKARGLEVKPTLLVSTAGTNDATKAKIRATLARIAASATPDDVFFLSFSGHGYSNRQGQFYILPSDVQGTCEGVDEHMLQFAISADELAEWLRPIDAGEMTFILDSCDSASSVESNSFKPGPMGSPGLGQLAYDKRMRILAASQPNQAARESSTLGQGLLSYALTQEGLIEGKADWKPVDGKIMVGEWLSYAADAVPKFLESGAVKTQRGLVPVGEPEHDVPAIQTPAVFDFSRTDNFLLQ